MSNLKLVTERDSSRQELAAAIEALGVAVIAGKQARAAIARAEGYVAKASDKLAAARDKSAQVSASRTASLIAAASSGADLPEDKTARAARLDEEDAAAELIAATTALEAVRENFCDSDYDAKRAEARRQAALDAILAGELARLKDEVSQAAHHLAGKLDALAFVSGQIAAPRHKAEIYQLDGWRDGFKIYHTEFAVRNGPATDAWREAIEALKANPDALLP